MSLKEEAKRWQVRASHVFSLGLYKLCVQCVNLGLKYTPVESKQTFSRFLCQRSEAEQQLGDYVRGLEDARSALKMTSELLEVIKTKLFFFTQSVNFHE